MFDRTVSMRFSDRDRKFASPDVMLLLLPLDADADVRERDDDDDDDDPLLSDRSDGSARDRRARIESPSRAPALVVKCAYDERCPPAVFEPVGSVSLITMCPGTPCALDMMFAIIELRNGIETFAPSPSAIVAPITTWFGPADALPIVGSGSSLLRCAGAGAGVVPVCAFVLVLVLVVLLSSGLDAAAASARTTRCSV